VADEETLLTPYYERLAADGMVVDVGAEPEERHVKDWEVTTFAVEMVSCQ
jgi:hypothetical protein